jgi:16S rRNA (guanine527-N7)-methyltransferase
VSRSDFLRHFDVSRETLARLDAFEALLLKWNARINLIGRSTGRDIWRRHFLDSAQLLDLAGGKARTWIDLGSGAGFPGLVVAVIAAERQPLLSVTMVESDQRKSAFLMAAIRETGVGARLLTRRVEDVAPEPYDVVSARALAPLARLLALSAPFRGPETRCLFPKGRAALSELTKAARDWNMQVEQHASISDPHGIVLEVRHCEARA